MCEVSTEELKEAVERLHDCHATFREVSGVDESFEGQRVWKGLVHTFDIEDHPAAATCYAWTSPIEGSEKRTFYAVLRIPPVDSPTDAVRASIIRDMEAG